MKKCHIIDLKKWLIYNAKIYIYTHTQKKKECHQNAN